VESLRAACLDENSSGHLMKLVLVNDGVYAYALNVPSAIGGAERQQWLLARALAHNGWSVTVGVRTSLNPNEERDIEGVNFVGLGRGNVLTAWYKFLSAVRPDWWYWRAVSHLWGPAVEIAKLAGVRTIYAAAFDSDVRPWGALRTLPQRRHWWPLYAWGLARTDRIFVQHGGQLAELPSRWQCKAYFVPSIADEAGAIKPHCERAPYVAWIGMLRQPKRPDLLIEVARRLPAVHFIVCGAPTTHRSPSGYGDRMVEELRKLVNVTYLGQVEPEKAQRCIADAAVFLSTSDEEGFPNTFLQAWASKTPVVSLHIDPDHVIAQKGVGVIAGNAENAAETIQSLLASPQQREEMTARAQQHVKAMHSERAVITAFDRAIQGDSRTTKPAMLLACKDSSIR